jgi:guanylate kinase
MITTQQRVGFLGVVSGPSGSGKTTLCRAARAQEQCYYTISATTRPPRPGEQDGIDYHFLSDEEFRRRVAAGEFLEWAEVYGRCYGTLRSEVVPRLTQGQDVLMDLDVQGAATLRRLTDPIIQRAHFDIFVMPPTFAELAARLEGRQSDSAVVRAQRLAEAEAEMEQHKAYHYTLLSRSKEEDWTAFRAILHAERMATHRLTLSL